MCDLSLIDLISLTEKKCTAGDTLPRVGAGVEVRPIPSTSAPSLAGSRDSTPFHNI